MYRLYLDEVGTDDLKHLEEDNHRYLSLTGTILKLDHVTAVLQPRLRQLKAECFDFDPDEKLCLHRSDIIRRKGVFGQLNQNIKRDRFDSLLSDLLSDVDYTVLTVLVDKLAMTRQGHWEQRHPYHFLMEVIVEKYAQFLERREDIGDIMPEARQGKKDRELQKAFEVVRGNGTRFVDASRIQSRIRANSLKFRRKPDDVAGLQLCDLLAHPSHMSIRLDERHPVVLGDFAIRVRNLLLQSKYDRSRKGQVRGYGTKMLP